MLLSALLVLLTTGLELCQGQETTNGSSLSSTPSSTPGCTLSYSPWMPPQIPPTTTIYESIMTTYFNVVDCDYCTVTIPDSTVGPSTQGRFTAKVTSPMLTITRVGCLAETTAITRRDIRGLSDLAQPQLWPLIPSGALTHELEAGDTMPRFSGSDLQEVANAIATHVDSDSSQLPQKLYHDLVSLNTALFAIQYVGQQLNWTEACDEFRQLVEPGQLLDTGIDPNQAGNIFCVGARFGRGFNNNTLEQANKIAAAIYALQGGKNFPMDLNRLCSYLDTPFAGFLGVNTTNIKQEACGSAHGTVSKSSATKISLVPPVTTAFPTLGPVGSLGPLTSARSWSGTGNSLMPSLRTSSSRSETAAPTMTRVKSGFGSTTSGAIRSAISDQSDQTSFSHSTNAIKHGSNNGSFISVGTGRCSGTRVLRGTHPSQK